MSCILQSRAFHRNHFLAELINKLRKNKDSFDQMTVTVTCAFSISFFLGLQLFFSHSNFFFAFYFGEPKNVEKPPAPMVFIILFDACVSLEPQMLSTKRNEENEKKKYASWGFHGHCFYLERVCVYFLSESWVLCSVWCAWCAVAATGNKSLNERIKVENVLVLYIRLNITIKSYQTCRFDFGLTQSFSKSTKKLHHKKKTKPHTQKARIHYGKFGSARVSNGFRCEFFFCGWLYFSHLARNDWVHNMHCEKLRAIFW